MRVRVRRVECDRTAVRSDRFIQPQPILQDDPEIAVPVGSLGLELETSLDQHHCVLAPRLLMREHAREVQSVGVVRGYFEDAAVDIGRSCPLLGLLQRERDCYGFVQRKGAVAVERLLHRRPFAGNGAPSAGVRPTPPSSPSGRT